MLNLLLTLFWCASFGYPFFFLLFFSNEPGLGTGIETGFAVTPFPSSIGCARTRTHDLSIVSRVRYQLDWTFSQSSQPSLTGSFQSFHLQDDVVHLINSLDLGMGRPLSEITFMSDLILSMEQT